MYKILLADDERIVVDSLKIVIESNFKDSCLVDCANTGRSVIELAESFSPDIAFVDIQMPGINGIDAMKEIKKTNPRIILIVLSAYDKFNYAKEAIHLGVLEYLQKPVNHKIFVEVLKKAMKLIDEQRRRRSDDLRIKEKLEFLVPVIENALISSVLLQQTLSHDIDKYQELLEISEAYGYMIILESVEVVEGGNLTKPAGAGFRLQHHYSDIRSKMKQYFYCMVGRVMSNRIVCLVPSESSHEDYEKRSCIIQTARAVVYDLNQRYNLQCRLGIGSITSIDKLSDSYKDAANSLLNIVGNVAYCKDLPLDCVHDEGYLFELEKRLFENVKHGKQLEAKEAANLYFDFIDKNYKDCIKEMKHKVLELVLLAEHLTYESSGRIPHFRERKDYLSCLLLLTSMGQLRNWFISKIEETTVTINSKKYECTNTAIEKAREYIHKNYKKDISLESVSREIDMSSYYFSKLFKNVTGENFIEYVTRIRVETAKKLLSESKCSVKEICIETGYSDPNYFCRIFKKYVGTTPTEYREGLD